MDQAGQEGIAEGGVADAFIPLLQEELAGDQGSLSTISIFEDREEISTLWIRERGEGVVAEDEELGLLEAARDLGIGIVTPLRGVVRGVSSV